MERNYIPKHLSEFRQFQGIFPASVNEVFQQEREIDQKAEERYVNEKPKHRNKKEGMKNHGMNTNFLSDIMDKLTGITDIVLDTGIIIEYLNEKPTQLQEWLNSNIFLDERQINLHL